MKIILLIALFSCLTVTVFSQSKWQWGKVGGSRSSYVGGTTHIEEEILSMATDPNGNVYAVAKVAAKAYVGGDSCEISNAGLIVMSWSCSGQLRWLKTTGASIISDIVTDTLGGVYMMGYIHVSSGNYFDKDTVIPPQHALKGNFIIKYDTSGHLKWLRMPDADTLSAAGYAGRPRFSHMVATPGGDLHTLCYLPAGPQANGAYTVSRTGYHVIRYNKDGQFLGGNRMNFMVPYDSNGEIMSSSVDGAFFKKDPVRGGYYLLGTIDNSIFHTDHIYIGNDTLRMGNNPRIFATSFDPSGNVKWLRNQDTSNFGTITDVVSDLKGNLYLSGQIYNGSRWNGATATAPRPSWGSAGMSQVLAYVSCMDSTGAHKWLSIGYDTTFSTNGMPFCMALNKNNELMVAGFLGSDFTWGTFSLSVPAPRTCSSSGGITYVKTGNYFAHLDIATGRCTGIDSLRITCGNGLSAAVAATDQNGNCYFGGRLTNPAGNRDSLLSIGPDKIAGIGGDTDFFIAKYGKVSCRQSTNRIANSPLSDGLKVYPNPATGTIHISGITTNLDYALYNNTGSKVSGGTVSGNPSTLDIEALPPGFYYIALRNKNGAKSEFKIIKQ